MKRLSFISTLCPITAALFGCFLTGAQAVAQAPEAIRYQAVARDGVGELVVNTAVGVQFQLHSGSAGGPVVYAETHGPTTNAQGLFTVAVGEGTATTGTFNSIDWAAATYWVEVGLDPAGGTAYGTIGVQQLLSVPYALQATEAGMADTANHALSSAVADFAGQAGTAVLADSATTAGHASTSDTATYAQQAGPPGTAAGEIRYWNGSAWVSLAPGSVGDALVYCGGVLRWGACTVQDRLDGGETPCQIANSGVPLDSLYGKSYLGGWIAYLNTTTCQGLVAATSDVPNSPWPSHPWGCDGTVIGGTSTAMFTGAANTALITAVPCSAGGAAQVASSFGPGWHLPSRDEVLALRTNLYLKGIGSWLTLEPYWTSSEATAWEAISVRFDDGNVSAQYKIWGRAVRPVKQF